MTSHPFCTRPWWHHLLRDRCRECALEQHMQDTWESIAKQFEALLREPTPYSLSNYGLGNMQNRQP